MRTLTVSVHHGSSARTAPEQIAEQIRQGGKFKNTTGSLTGHTAHSRQAGQLSDSERAKMESAGELDYVIYSYATPIAYRSAATGEWHQVEQKFSVTTTGHQSVVRRTLALL